MGPYEILLQCGANIIALDIDRKPVWQRLIATARKHAGSITFPLKESVAAAADVPDERLAELAGANLFTQAPEIANWLCDLFPDKVRCWCVCASVLVCVCVCVRTCVYVCMCVCVFINDSLSISNYLSHTLPLLSPTGVYDWRVCIPGRGAARARGAGHGCHYGAVLCAAQGAAQPGLPLLAHRCLCV